MRLQSDSTINRLKMDPVLMEGSCTNPSGESIWLSLPIMPLASKLSRCLGLNLEPFLYGTFYLSSIRISIHSKYLKKDGMQPGHHLFGCP